MLVVTSLVETRSAYRPVSHKLDTAGWSQCPMVYMAPCSLLIGSILVATLSSDSALLGVNCVNCSNYMFSDMSTVQQWLDVA